MKNEEDFTFLICDDDEDTCDLIQMIGNKNHHKVVICLDYEDLDKTLDAHDPDVIFMDLHWGGIKGVDVIKSLKKNRTTKIYAVSGAANIKEIAEAEKIEGYIEKPFSFKIIQGLMDKLAAKEI